MTEAIFSKADLCDALERLGIRRGDRLNVKVSMRALGPVEGGAGGLVEAFLECIGPEEGLLVADAFVGLHRLPLSGANAARVSTQESPADTGAFANAVVAHPASFRARHPMQKFSLIGAGAKELAEGFTADSPPYDIFAKLAQMDAKNLRIGPLKTVPGVGTTHVAIEKLGLMPRYRPRLGMNYRDEASGEVKLFTMNWAHVCAQGFNNLQPFYRADGGILAEMPFGRTEAMLTSMKSTLKTELCELARDPRILLCQNPDCTCCRIGWSFSDTSLPRYLFRYARRKLRERYLS